MLEFRNKLTSEYRKVDEGSDEHIALLKERQEDAPQRPVWEQVGIHTREAFEKRLETGALDTTDYGDADQPINRGPNDTLHNRDALVTTPTKDVARQTPTAAERAQGAGRAAEGANLDQRLRGADAATAHLTDDEDVGDSISVEDPPAEHPEQQINEGGEDIEDLKQDDPRFTDPSSGGYKSDDDYDGKTVDELRDEADSRELQVEGTGKNGNVLQDDLIKALRADDRKNAE